MKKLWLIFPALLIAGLVMMGCPTDDPGGTTGDITWTLSADGAGAEGVGTEDTTEITINFSAAVSGLSGQDITVTGPIDSDYDFDGSGKTYVISVTPTASSSVSVTINKAGIVKGPKSIAIWKEGAAHTTGYSVIANNVDQTTTSLTLTFDEAVSGLAVTDINITSVPGGSGGTATANELSGSGAAYTLTIIVDKQGPVNVKITKDGIDDSSHEVTVLLKATAGPPAIPADGQTPTLKWHKLAVDHSDDDAEVQAANEAQGKGVITGADFAAVVAATGFQGTYLRVYLDETAVPSNHNGWGIGALGNILDNTGKPSGQANLTFNATAPGGYAYAELPLKTLKDYYEVDDGEIFVNAWDGAIIRAILLYEPIPAVPEVTLPAGTQEIAVPNGDPPGKGLLGGPDVGKINASGPGSYLEVYFKNSPGAEWGMGNIITTNPADNDAWVNKITLKTPAGGAKGDDFMLTFKVADIKYAFDVMDYDVTTKHANGTITGALGFNIWDCYIDKIYLITPVGGEDPPPPVEVTLTDTLKIFDATDGLMTGVTVTTGTYDDDDGTLTTTAGTDSNNDNQADYTLVLTFEDPIDLDDYTHLVVEFGGIHASFKQIGSFMPGFNTDSKVMAQISSIQSTTMKYELGTELKDWGGSDDWEDATPMTVLEIYVNAIDYDNGTSWVKLMPNTQGILDMSFTSIRLEKWE